MIIRCRCILENREGEIFVVKQRAEYNFWSLPGGKLDPDETTVMCIQRELVEELGLDVEPTLRIINEIPNIQSLEFLFYAKILENELHLDMATHAFEIQHGSMFVDPLDKKNLIYPEFLQETECLEWLRGGEGIRYILN